MSDFHSITPYGSKVCHGSVTCVTCDTTVAGCDSTPITHHLIYLKCYQNSHPSCYAFGYHLGCLVHAPCAPECSTRINVIIPAGVTGQEALRLPCPKIHKDHIQGNGNILA